MIRRGPASRSKRPGGWASWLWLGRDASDRTGAGQVFRGSVVVLACLLAVSTVVSGQSGNTAGAIGAEEIKRVLTGHKRWAFYWDRGVARPRLGPTTSTRSPSATFEFMGVGPRFVGYASNDLVHHAECEFDVEAKRDGFSFTGCWGSDKSMTYDPDDREYPFKGHVEGTRFWLAPSH